MKKLVLILGLCLSLGANARAEDNSFKDCDFIIYNKCISCNTPYAFEVGYDVNCTSVCPNRDVLHEGSGYYSRKFCFLKQCPDDKPYRHSDGSCYSSIIINVRRVSRYFMKMSVFLVMKPKTFQFQKLNAVNVQIVNTSILNNGIVENVFYRVRPINL